VYLRQVESTSVGMQRLLPEWLLSMRFHVSCPAVAIFLQRLRRCWPDMLGGDYSAGLAGFTVAVRDELPYRESKMLVNVSVCLGGGCSLSGFASDVVAAARVC
jgi:hypothetical protein